MLWPEGMPRGGATLQRDKDLVRKAVLIVHRREMPENWLRDSVAAVANTEGVKNRLAFFHRCLENKAADAGRRLDRLLAATTIPADLVKPADPKGVPT